MSLVVFDISVGIYNSSKEKSIMPQVNNDITIKCKLLRTGREEYFDGKISKRLCYTLTTKIFGENIFVEQMFGGFFIKSPKISVNNFGEKGF